MTPAEFYAASAMAGVFLGKLLLIVGAVALLCFISDVPIFTRDKE